MAHYRDREVFARHETLLRDQHGDTHYFRLGRTIYLAVTTRVEEVPRHWKDYRRCGYEFNMTFIRYLNENGVDAKLVPIIGELEYLSHIETPAN